MRGAETSVGAAVLSCCAWLQTDLHPHNFVLGILKKFTKAFTSQLRDLTKQAHVSSSHHHGRVLTSSCPPQSSGALQS